MAFWRLVALISAIFYGPRKGVALVLPTLGTRIAHLESNLARSNFVPRKMP